MGVLLLLKVEFKKISEDTLLFMRDSVGSSTDFYAEAVNVIGDLLSPGEVHILNSANSCLTVLAESIPEPVLVPDMGGWNGFNKACDLFGKKVLKIKTHYGLVDIEELDNYLRENEIKTLYITSLAGYTARQPLDEISKLCDTHHVLLIVDISGSVGDKTRTTQGDLQVASTGSPKIINIENGGIINNITKKVQLNKHLLKSMKADNITCAGIVNEAPKAMKIEEKTRRANHYLKQELQKRLDDDPVHNVIHPSCEGLNTIITAESKGSAKKLAYNIRQKIESKRNIITTGPNYNRIKKASINIETKNINPSWLTRENLDKLAELVVKEIEKEGG